MTLLDDAFLLLTVVGINGISGVLAVVRRQCSDAFAVAVMCWQWQ